MKRTRVIPDLSRFPKEFHPLLQAAPVHDSSCSQDAKVWYLEAEGGLFLKTGPKGQLKPEAEMTRYFHGKGLSAEVLSYLSEDRDWLLTRRISGEDCVFPTYLEDPKRLCDTIALLLRQLHEMDFEGCPVVDRCEEYLESARRGYEKGFCDLSLFPDHWGFSSAEEAWELVQANGTGLKADTLLHGDYCLPNILLDNWRFSGFIDLGGSGVGDRHIDLFWGAWTLFFNLKTNEFYDRFLDAYGRDKIEPELLRTVAALEVFR